MLPIFGVAAVLYNETFLNVQYVLTKYDLSCFKFYLSQSIDLD